MLQHTHEERLIVLHAECVFAWDEDVLGEIDPDAVGAAEAVWTGDTWHLSFDILLECGKCLCVVRLEELGEDGAEGKFVVPHDNLSCVLGYREQCWWCGRRGEGLRVLWEFQFVWYALVDVLRCELKAAWSLDLLGEKLDCARGEVDGSDAPDDILDLNWEIFEEVEDVVWVVWVNWFLLHLGPLPLLDRLVVEVGIEYLSVFGAKLWLAEEIIRHAGVDSADSSADEAVWDDTDRERRL